MSVYVGVSELRDHELKSYHISTALVFILSQHHRAVPTTGAKALVPCGLSKTAALTGLIEDTPKYRLY